MIAEKIKLLEKVSNRKFKFVAQHGIKNTNYPTHSHDFNELFIIVSGTAVHRIGRGSQPLERGDVFLIKNSELEHSFENPERLELYNFMFDDSFLQDLNLDMSQLEGYQTLFILEPFFLGKNNYQNKLKLNVQGSSEIINLAQRILKEYSNKKAGYMSITKALFIELLVTIFREFATNENYNSSNKLVTLGKAVSHIENNFNQSLNIKILAEIACLSERQFNRKFKACYKKAPFTYINNLRINYSKELLRNPSETVKNIAYHTGFTDQNYFCRKFKELVGITPSEFQKLNSK